MIVGAAIAKNPDYAAELRGCIRASAPFAAEHGNSPAKTWRRNIQSKHGNKGS